MTTRDHLIYQLQETYALLRDFLPLLDVMHHESRDQTVRRLLDEQREGMRNELDTLERALNLLGAQYRMERNPVVPGLKEANQRFKRRMNPSQEQLDVHSLLETMTVAELTVGAYQGESELAKVIGEPDVALLLEENHTREQQGLNDLRAYAASLIEDIGSREARRAA